MSENGKYNYQGNRNTPNERSFDRGNKTSNYVMDKKFEEASMAYLRNTSIFNDIHVKEEVKDYKRQKRGIDIIAEIDNIDTTVDVKAIASQLPTFCFELAGSVSTGQVGWLINDELETDYYLLVYHDTGGDDSYSFSKNKIIKDNACIQETEAILIKKSALLNKIEEEIHCDLNRIVELIRQKDTSKYRTERLKFNAEGEIFWGKGGNIYFTLSKKLKEQPINVVVRKNILYSIATKRWLIQEK